MTLTEQYKNRLAISEKMYAQSHKNEAMPSYKKLTVARLLDNTSKFLSEAFENSTGTQRSDLGNYKKFCLNLVTVAIPNLIGPELVIVHPMSSITGYIAYVSYTAGSNKGETSRGDVFNDPFKLGKADKNYTAERVVETTKIVAEDTDYVVRLGWTPVLVTEDNKLAQGRIIKVTDGTEITNYEVTKEGVIKFTNSAEQQDQLEVKVAYIYDNVLIPANDVPMLNAKMETITLAAKARRIAVYYSNIANYQAKQDYGFDLGGELAAKAVGQLNYKYIVA